MTKQYLKEVLHPEECALIKKMAISLLQDQTTLYNPEKHKYFDLAIWLGFLRALGMIHHTHHWQMHGDQFYGDHLLLERLYKHIEGEVDTLGEKIIGLDSPELTNLFLQLKHINCFTKEILNQDNMILESLKTELIFVSAGEMIVKRLSEEGLLTKGLDNLMSEMLDSHEGFVYLLNQRLAMC